MRQDPDYWTRNMWARVYAFLRGNGEGWAGRHDGFHARKFRTDPDSKDGFHPRERRVLEFIFPILHLEKLSGLV